MGREQGTRAAAAELVNFLGRFLIARDDVIEARRRAQAKDQSEAGEYLALEHLNVVEEELLTQVLEPKFGAVLGVIRNSLAEAAGAAALPVGERR